MKKFFITLVIILIGSFAFANEAEKDVEIISVELENHIENVEAVAYCTTETYTHTKTVKGFSMLVGYETEITYTYTSGACTRCYGTTFTLDCWGSRFPPINW